jgi:DNA invertase Pin-like site-specific DNA recombinase
MGPRVRAVAYVRVSTDNQVEHGVSLDAQQAKLMAYAALYELDLVAMEVDAVVTAKRCRDRPSSRSSPVSRPARPRPYSW